MPREDWRDERRWYEDREDREFQRAPDYGPAGYGYNGRDDRTHPGYRAAREDAWLDDRRRAEAPDPGPSGSDQRAYQPFGSTGPTAYGPYGESPYAWGGGYNPYGAAAPHAGPYGAFGAASSDYGRQRYETGRFGLPQGDRRPGEGRSFLDKAADEVASWFGFRDAEHRRREEELRAPHRGRGPKSYKRADGRIQEDINDRLTEDPYLDATDIEVSVANGEVTLTGMVISREDKRRAERLAEEVSGVDDVQNNLRLRRSETGQAAGEIGGEPLSSGNF